MELTIAKAERPRRSVPDAERKKMSGGYQIKVWGISDGRNRLVVAARTQKEAATLLGMSLRHFRRFAAVTANIVECGVALNQQGKVFFQPHNDVLEPFKQLRPDPQERSQ